MKKLLLALAAVFLVEWTVVLSGVPVDCPLDSAEDVYRGLKRHVPNFKYDYSPALRDECTADVPYGLKKTFPTRADAEAFVQAAPKTVDGFSIRKAGGGEE